MARRKVEPHDTCNQLNQTSHNSGPRTKSSPRELEGMRNLAKTGSLYKQEMKDDTKRGGEFPKQDTPFLAANEPPEKK
jgi:hypothetical protein